jgi:hypothetical protein
MVHGIMLCRTVINQKVDDYVHKFPFQETAEQRNTKLVLMPLPDLGLNGN